MKDNSKYYNIFINSIENETIRYAFYNSTFEGYSKWGDCSILEIVKNIPFEKIETDEKFKHFFYTSPELSLLKLNDDDFLKQMDKDWERLIEIYTTNQKIIRDKEDEFIDELENDTTEEQNEDELEDKICLEVNKEKDGKKI